MQPVSPSCLDRRIAIMDRHLDPVMPQSLRQRQPSDPGSDDDNAHEHPSSIEFPTLSIRYLM